LHPPGHVRPHEAVAAGPVLDRGGRDRPPPRRRDARGVEVAGDVGRRRRLRRKDHREEVAVADPSAPRSPFAPWDRRELPGLFTVEESARRVGHYAWIEMRLFEALGGWVATVPELDVKMRLGTHCYHHAWHAELWNKRLPERREMNTDRLSLPANDAMVEFMEAMTEPERPDQTIEKLVGV